MSDVTNAAESLAADAGDEGAQGGDFKPPTMSEAQAAAASGEAEGTTPEEVAQVLKGAGIKLPPEPKAAAADAGADDGEEGDDPDAGAADDGGDGSDGAAAGADDEGAGAGDGSDDDGGDGSDADDDLADDGKPTPTDAEVKAAQDARAAEISDKYAFEVTDANGVTFKITPDATLEEVLEEFEPKNNGQIIDILNKLQEAKAAKSADEADEAEQTAKAERAQRASEIQKGWQQESKDLQASGRIPKGTDGDKRVAEVYKFMAEINDQRMAKNLPTINSFEDALDKLEAKEIREGKVEQDKKDKEDARKNGALVGGSSAPSTSSGKSYKPGMARNANEAIRKLNLI